ncbi:MAG: phosphoribosylamine--glycine ligase [Anaerolineales bacterium]|jgi:phosphoribosylamine--glycine ligase
MRVLLVGQGGREHAVAEALARSSRKLEMNAYMSSKNPGITNLCSEYAIGPMSDVVKIADYAWSRRTDLVVIGPEEPLIHGLADELYRRAIPCVGPRQKLAQMEGDKAFLRQAASKYIPEANPHYRNCTTPEEVKRALLELGEVAVKPLGLTSGKGVKVMGAQLPTQKAAEEYALELLRRDRAVLLEERLSGDEFSQMIFTDGIRIIPMPLVQDAKYAQEGDTGPMTGGMGAYSMADHDLPFVGQEMRSRAILLLEKLLDGVQGEYNERYHGILYGQFMMTARGPVIIEVNVRLGDPEAINVMSILSTDPVEVFQGMACGLPDQIDFQAKATVCKYLVPESYPEKPVQKICIGIAPIVFEQNRTKIIFAGVEKEGDIYCSTGSRFAAVLAVRDSLVEADEAVERTIESIEMTGLRHRKDICRVKES